MNECEFLLFIRYTQYIATKIKNKIPKKNTVLANFMANFEDFSNLFFSLKLLFILLLNEMLAVSIIPI